MSIDLRIDNDRIAHIVLSAPERLNAITAGDFADLRTRLAAVRDDDTVRGLTLRGSGRAFCAGADLGFLTDLNGMTEIDRRNALAPGSDLIRDLIRIPVPTVAVVDGPAFGIGASLALGCDTIIATPRSRFGLVFTSLGLPAGDMAMPWLLTRRVGSRCASRLLIDAAIVSADEAHETGLVDMLASAEELDPPRIIWSTSSLSAIRTTKRQILDIEGAFEELDQRLETELDELSLAVGDPAFAKRVAQLRQK